MADRDIAATNGAGGMIVRDGKDGLQIVENGRKRWSAAAEQVFLEMLAATCNVTRSAKAADFTTRAIYKRRMTWPGFAERWEQALAQGYARIELLLVETASDTLAGLPVDPERPIPMMTVKEALAVLQLHKGAVKRGDVPGMRWRLTPLDPDAARASILKKVAAVRRARLAQLPDLTPPAP